MFSSVDFLRNIQFGFGKELPIILQSNPNENAFACLAMISGYFGVDIQLRDLHWKYSMAKNEQTLSSLIEVASSMELVARPVQLQINNLHMLQTPCILKWGDGYVVLKKAKKYRIVIHDPRIGVLTFPNSDAASWFSGAALELMPSPLFRKLKQRERIRLREIMGRVLGLKRSLLQIMLLTLALELFVLAAPFYSQWVMDNALLSRDRDLLYTLAIGFGLVTIFQVATEAMRSWVVIVLSTSLNFQWLANVFKHLLHLPITYFEKRHMGDIVSRFNSIHVIQATLTTGFIEIILDGVLSIGTIIVMFLYSPFLSAITLSVVTIYTILRVSLYGSLRAANQKEIVFAAKQQTHFMESVRAIQSIRLFNKAEERVSHWLNIVVGQKNCNVRTQRLTLIFKMSNRLLFGIENIAVILFGAIAVLDTRFSIGMLLAFISYKDQFSKRMGGVVDKLLEVKLLQIHAARLGEIVLASPERDDVPHIYDIDHIEPSIEVRNLSFRYSEKTPLIFNNFSMKIEPGESVSIVGPSGAGKTTLLKLLLGIIQPTSGEILIGGIPMRLLGLYNYRNMVGTVMQEDQLLAGTIAENISFFSQNSDEKHIQYCAQKSEIHTEIISMLAGYRTLVGDLGASLSVGQRQRILLARALYKKPKIIFLDEATSNLDISNERKVSSAISQLNLTRIIVAHRPETISSTNRSITLAMPEK